MIERERLLSLERDLWRNDPAIYKETLLPDATLVFAETGRISRDQAVEEIKQENAEGRRWADVAFSEIHVSRLAGDVVLLHYRVHARWEHEAEAIGALASSVYVRRDDRWRLAFHQQTEIREP
jgi:uncharacterized protein (TIGR02246 family)